MTKPYKVQLTHSAKVSAAKRGLTETQLEALIRQDLRENGYHEDDDTKCWPPKLFFHVVGHREELCWLVVGDGKDTVTVDSASYKEGKELESGPFKGKKLCLPVGDEIDGYVSDE